VGIAAQERRAAPRAAGGPVLQGAARAGRGAERRHLLAQQRPRRLVRERRPTRERASVPCKREFEQI